MKRKTTLLTVFLLMLCISSMVFVSAYDPAAIVRPNVTKDFTLAIDGNSWLEGWDYRREIPLTGSAGAGTEYQLLVTVSYDSDMQTDFDDIRFTANNGNTSLDYYIESKVDSGYALMWVEVSADLGTDQLIYIYYGNSEVSTTSNGTATFLMFDDFDDGVLDETNWHEWGGASGTPSETGGSQQLVGGLGVWSFWGTYEQWSDDIALGLSIKADAESHYWVIGLDERTYDNTAPDGVDQAAIAFDTSTKYYTATANGANTKNARSTLYTSYVTCEIQWTGDIEFYEAHSLADTIAVDPVGDMGIALMSYGVRTTYMNWVYVRNCIDTEPTVGSFGDEELYSEWSPVEWQDVGSAILYFNVPFDYWGLNMVLVFGGLILMLGSACIVAVKVRDRTINQDSGMLFLVLFCVGWGLFIGGTLIG